MWRFHKICCYLGQHPKRKGSISPSKFDGQLSHILFTHICLCVGVLGLLVCCCSLFSSQTSSSSSLPVICQFYEPERKWISGCEPCYHCHTLRKKREIKAVSALTRLRGVPLRKPELVKWLSQGKCFWCRLLGCTQK